MEYIYQPNQLNQVNQSTTKVFLYSILCFILGIIITLIVCYIIYELYLRKIEPPKQIIVEQPEPIKIKLKLPENDLNIDDTLDENCIQKRKIYDSDFDRTIYPINDNEIIYF
jgi:hypothetical protein